MDTFTKIIRGGKTAYVREEYAEAVAAALLEGEGCTPITGAGRGAIVRFEYPGGRGIIRNYLRGGVVQRVLKDAYVLANRPLREFYLHRQVVAKGLPVPPLLGVCWERRGLLVRGAIATTDLDAVTLYDLLVDSTERPEELLRQCGAVIRQMHDMDIWHADLQVRNILVAGGRPYLIDFDKARIYPDLSPLLRYRNLLRLRRSLEKNGLSADSFDVICAGYGIEALPAWLDGLYRSKGRLADLASGRRVE